MKRLLLPFLILLIFLCGHNRVIASDTLTKKDASHRKPGNDNVVIELPQGFKAMVFADNLGRARHIVVNKNGDVYVKLERLKDGKGIFRLRKNKNSKGVTMKGFGNYIGTGIAIKNGYLYATSNTTIYRYKLGSNNEIVNPAHPDIIVSGLTDQGQ